MGKIYTFIHKDKVNSKVHTSKLQEYLDTGWEIGNWNQEALNAKSGAGVKNTYDRMKKDGIWDEWNYKRNKKVSAGLQKFWSEVADEDYINNREVKKQQSRDSWTAEEKEFYRNKMSNSAKLNRASISPEEYHRRAVKGNNTKKNNGSYGVSSYEIICKNVLEEAFGKDDIVYSYDTDERYPFNCDFYIKSIDVFIELNIHPSHGLHRFDCNCEEDLKYKQQLEEMNSDWSNMMLSVWCNRDVSKYDYAVKNKLNYIQIYNDKFGLFIDSINEGNFRLCDWMVI